jgi:hypothetical protein
VKPSLIDPLGPLAAQIQYRVSQPVSVTWEGGEAIDDYAQSRHAYWLYHAQEVELEIMTKYKAVPDSEKDEDLPGWIHREIRDHNRRYECDGHIFVDGRWGGLVCKKCGR